MTKQQKIFLVAAAIAMLVLAYLFFIKKNIKDETDVKLAATNNGTSPSKMTPYEKYMYDIANPLDNDMLNWYRNTGYNEGGTSLFGKTFKQEFPNKMDFWAWLWEQKTYGAYKSYNAKSEWDTNEKVATVK